jgi:hypothetical protein
VASYLDDPKDAVTIAAQFAQTPGGPNRRCQHSGEWGEQTAYGGDAELELPAELNLGSGSARKVNNDQWRQLRVKHDTQETRNVVCSPGAGNGCRPDGGS